MGLKFQACVFFWVCYRNLRRTPPPPRHAYFEYPPWASPPPPPPPLLTHLMWAQFPVRSRHENFLPSSKFKPPTASSSSEDKIIAPWVWRLQRPINLKKFLPLSRNAVLLQVNWMSQLEILQLFTRNNSLLVVNDTTDKFSGRCTFPQATADASELRGY